MTKDTRSKKCIFIPRGEQPVRWYHTGTYINELPNALFSYNVPLEWGSPVYDSIVEIHFDMVEKAFNSDDFSRAHAVHYWKAAQAQQETIETLRPINITNEATAKHLFDGFHVVFGKQSCVYTDVYHASRAEGMGWSIISLRDGPARVAMHAGVKSDTVMVNTLDAGDTMKHSALTKIERDRLLLAGKIIQALEFDVIPIHIVKDFRTDGFVRKGNQGIYRKEESDMVITRATLAGPNDPKGPKAKFNSLHFLEVVLHEQVHHETQATDGSNEFVAHFIWQWMAALDGARGVIRSGKIADLMHRLLEL